MSDSSSNSSDESDRPVLSDEFTLEHIQKYPVRGLVTLQYNYITVDSVPTQYESNRLKPKNCFSLNLCDVVGYQVIPGEKIHIYGYPYNIKKVIGAMHTSRRKRRCFTINFSSSEADKFVQWRDELQKYIDTSGQNEGVKILFLKLLILSD